MGSNAGSKPSAAVRNDRTSGRPETIKTTRRPGAFDAGSAQPGSEDSKAGTDRGCELKSRLRQARLRSGVTLAMMGRALGVSAQQVTKYESGQSRLSASRLPIWARICSISVDELLAGSAVAKQNVFGIEGILRLIQAFMAITDAEVRHNLIETTQAVAIADMYRRERNG